MIKKRKKKIIRRRKKSIFPNFFFSISLFSSIIILSALGFLLFSPRFQIDNLVISGNTNLSTEEIERIANEKMKTSFSVMGMDFVTESIFLSLGGKINQIKEAMPEIERISIKKNFPSGLSLEIVEKTPFALWKYNNEEFLVDKNGSFIRYIEKDDDVTELIQIKQEDSTDLDKKELINNILIISSKLSKEEISVLSYNIFNDRLKVDTTNNFFILLDLRQDLSWQIEKLIAVLDRNDQIRRGENVKYIDLRFDNQAIIQK
ncbi:MAG: FtsQ-type POTRA domain-containing protein [Candidatus Pacebacteria bacterium]|nr:FtsQ-type POTRA domain-containing protein [Candidatus Paceibacterota bacterium]MDD2757703.1 FtsQ-type POTRA domain-containing protein [Candidatus Paceibacterota bacterium]MDD3283773.1 FtsQ-type POTRA domain-containing protein [Candidatus Paceibacterota bacterium]MDD3969979.1 FtsQ-type POTRA domain-containing protein [Candidatus Paceibacterota bacterium]